jgi:phenylpropionate dioxygenase-like ring-hydroxylating dioxygenase large terminal subunit
MAQTPDPTNGANGTDGTDAGVAPDDRIERLLALGIRNRWYCVAASARITDAPVALTRLGDRLVLWRDGDGLVHVQQDRCPHRGAPLSRGRIIDGRLTCAYHGVQLDGDGTVVTVPAFPDCEMVGQSLVKTYPVIEHYGAIFSYFGDEAHPDPVPFTLPEELTSDDWAGYIYAETWGSNHQFILDNLADPMHAPYLHNESYTLAFGSKDDVIEITDTTHGFEVGRRDQRNVNFDWLEYGDTGGYWIRVDVFYPPGAGPGGNLRILCFVTPIDEATSRIHFWRCRKVAGWRRDMWRFLFKTRLEYFAWEIMQQDRNMLEALPPWPAPENLYQHDIGVTRLRRTLRREAESQIRELTDAGAP